MFATNGHGTINCCLGCDAHFATCFLECEMKDERVVFLRDNTIGALTMSGQDATLD